MPLLCDMPIYDMTNDRLPKNPLAYFELVLNSRPPLRKILISYVKDDPQFFQTFFNIKNFAKIAQHLDDEDERVSLIKDMLGTVKLKFRDMEQFFGYCKALFPDNTNPRHTGVLNFIERVVDKNKIKQITLKLLDNKRSIYHALEMINVMPQSWAFELMSEEAKEIYKRRWKWSTVEYFLLRIPRDERQKYLSMFIDKYDAVLSQSKETMRGIYHEDYSAGDISYVIYKEDDPDKSNPFVYYPALTTSICSYSDPDIYELQEFLDQGGIKEFFYKSHITRTQDASFIPYEKNRFSLFGPNHQLNRIQPKADIRRLMSESSNRYYDDKFQPNYLSLILVSVIGLISFLAFIKYFIKTCDEKYHKEPLEPVVDISEDQERLAILERSAAPAARL